MNAIVVGPSRGMVEALEEQGAAVETVDPPATRDRLEAAGLAGADLVVITDVGEASAVPVVRKLTDGVRVVVYDHESLPDFARPQVDLAVDPDLLEPGVVAEELLDDRE